MIAEIVWDEHRQDWAYRVLDGETVYEAGALSGDSVLRRLLADNQIGTVVCLDDRTMPGPWVEMMDGNESASGSKPGSDIDA